MNDDQETPVINQSTIVWIGVPLFGKEGLGEIFRRCLLNYGLLNNSLPMINFII